MRKLITRLDRSEGWAVGLLIETGGCVRGVAVDNEGSLFVGVKSECTFVIGRTGEKRVVLWALR